MLKKVLFTTVGLSLFIGCFIGCSQMLEKRADIIKVPEVAPGAIYVGSEACYDCHEDLANDRHNNVHMRIASFEAYGYQHGCEGCHGPGSVHVDEDGDPEKILRFGKDGLAIDEVAGVCTTCHQAGAQMNWAYSEHALSDVTCTSCHNIHNNSKKYLLAEKEIDLCVSCHKSQKAKMNYMSRHPLKEGKMTCDSCHEPHGTQTGADGMLKTEERVNDLCLECHTRYQGPFVFEHAPVSESCLECHEPHGTVANNLLKQNEPFLCLQCHEAHFHANREGKIGLIPAKGGTLDAYNDLTPHAIEGRSHDDWSRGMLTKCTTCHQSVHGSDLPSQAGALLGAGLTR
jgi:DmsE family decaheme c-type cytochrome